jgi:hypothetical protein
VWCSCGTDSSEIGTDFFNEGALDISYVDSVSVKLSTVNFDSLITSDIDKILLGSYNDTKLGRLTTTAYFQPGVNGAIDLDEDKVLFDYAAIVLAYDAYSYYDTTKTLKVTAYKVAEEMEAEDNGYLYNTSHFSTEAAPLGSVSFLPRPHRTDTVEIILDETFALDLYQKAIEGDDALSSNSEFLEYLNGIALVSDTTGSPGIIGFALPEVRLYYKDKNETPVEQKYVSFPVTGNFSNLYCTNITTDRSLTKLATLPEFKSKLSSVYTDDEAYLQSGAGLALRVDMPYLKDLTQFDNVFVTQAILEIYPVRKSFNDLKPLPESLLVYKVDKRNAVIYQYGSNASLYEDIYLGLATRYVLDVTSFVKEQMAIQEFNENALFFMLNDPTFRNGVDRFYASTKGKEYRTRLSIYYATVNNN